MHALAIARATCSQASVHQAIQTALQHPSEQDTPVDSFPHRQLPLSNPLAATEQVLTYHAGIMAVPRSVHVPSLVILQWPQSLMGPRFLPPTAPARVPGSVPQ